MTFLELCQEVRREARIPGTGPTSTQSQVGLLGDVVAATRSAWTTVQLLHYESWQFMRGAATAELPPGRDEFTLAELSAENAARLVEVLIDNKPLERIEWFDMLKLIQNRSRNGETTPSKYALDPSNRVLFSCKLEDFTDVTTLFVRGPETLTENDQVPSVPDQHHMIIVWQAVMDLAANESDTVIYQKAFEKFESYLTRLEHDQLPPVTLGGKTFS